MRAADDLTDDVPAAGGPALRLTTDPGPPLLAAVDALLGRAAALEELLEVLRTVRKGHVRTVVLEGPLGSGKTALLELFLDHCRSAARGVRVLSATGDEWESQLALAGYSQLMLATPLRSSRGFDGEPAPPSAPVAELSPAQAVNYAATLSTHLESLQTHGSVVVTLRTAVYIVACTRVLEARALRGLYP